MLASVEKFEYENDNIVKSKIYNPQDQMIQYRTFIYNENGNVSKEEYFICYGDDNAPLQARTEYEYDNKINPFKVFAVEGSPGIYSNTNNIIMQKTINYYEGEEQVNTMVNSFEYNNLGYPVKCNNVKYIYGVDK